VRKKAAPEQATPEKPGRDPEDRLVDPVNSKAKREKMLDKTIADSFPASDAPSSLPDPSEDSFSEWASGVLGLDGLPGSAHRKVNMPMDLRPRNNEGSVPFEFE